ncbi:MAG TPA: ABC transporter permease, partial [Anaerolineae bacterium]|nr:ABC transporter permease [Anaerolineae bacterium]HUM36734.1 ABC transporter permease [Anaerolineae bacterium]
MDPFIISTLASIVANAAPIIYASIGETLTEKAGVINLSLDGTILLTAMASFAVAYNTGSVLLGFLCAALIGALIAGIVALASIELEQEQVAVGFVLTLLAADLSSFLGNPYVNLAGPYLQQQPFPLLNRLPIVGDIFFNHNLAIYGSFAVILAAWWWMAKTQPGLRMRGVGERPESAFARGVNVFGVRYAYTLLGGALVGIGGATYSLVVKLGWSHNHTTGNGWIALAIVIFGGWDPWKVAGGAYLFGALRALGSALQRNPAFVNVPTQIFATAPFALMILFLALTSSG